MNRSIAGRYHPTDRIGAGGMGEVWKAHDSTLDRVVALKMLRGDRGEVSTNAAERLEREAQLGLHLKHSNLVLVHDVVKDDDGWPVLVMEYIDGKDLKQLSEGGGVLWPQLVPWVLEVLEALTYMHAQGAIHRDVKPANIFVATGSGAKLGDLGVARRQTDPRFTATGVIHGTPNYLAPEVALDFGDATTSSDIWSLGATILTSVAPERLAQSRTEDDLPAIRGQARRNPWLLIQERDYLVAAGVPKRIARLVSRMLSDDPDARPTAEASLAELREALANGIEDDANEGYDDDALGARLHQVFVVDDLRRRVPNNVLRPYMTLTSDSDEAHTKRLNAADLYTWWSSSPPPMVIVGDSGTGKTTTSLMLVEQVLEAFRRTGDGPLAVNVSVARWRPTWGSLREWVSKETSLRTMLAHTEFSDLLDAERLVVVLDQADELDPATLRAFATEIDRWSNDPTSTRLVLNCQPATFERVLEARKSLAEYGFTRVNIDRLDMEEIEGYLRDQGAIQDGSTPNTGEWVEIREHLDRPVHLVAAMAAFGGQPLDHVLERIGPDGFWAAYFDARIADAVTDSKHTSHEVFRWMAWLARLTPGNGTFWLSDGVLPAGARRTLMWIAGPAIGLLAAGIFLALSDNARSPLETVAVVGLLTICPWMGLHSVGDGRMRFMRFSGRRLRQGAGVALAMAIAATSLASLVMSMPAALFLSVMFALTIGARVATAVQFDRVDNVYKGKSARDLIRNALFSGFLFGPLYGLTIGLLLSQFVGLPFGLTWALLWLGIGGQGGYLHHVLWRVREWRTNGAPPVPALVQNLEWCATKGLLRVDGASPGFNFLHAQQWSYFHDIKLAE